MGSDELRDPLIEHRDMAVQRGQQRHQPAGS